MRSRNYCVISSWLVLMSCLGEKASESAYEDLVTQVDYPVDLAPQELPSPLGEVEDGGGDTSPVEDMDFPEPAPMDGDRAMVIQVIELQTMDELIENRDVVDAVVNLQVEKMGKAEESLDAIIGDLQKQKDREMALSIGKPHETFR